MEPSVSFNGQRQVLAQMGLGEESILSITPFVREEDQTEYQVWRVDCPDRRYVLKQVKEDEEELELYRQFLTPAKSYAPELLGTAHWEQGVYLLTAFVEGEDLRHCETGTLRRTLDALIAAQKEYWAREDRYACGYSLEKSLPGREKRGAYLNDNTLHRAYAKFLQRYRNTPLTLCHDDLLPFNVLVNEEKAVLLDWEYGGMLPYPVSLARLIAHGREEEQAFFYMTEEDRQFAIAYYYENLVREKGIPFSEYRQTLDYFLFYEYCEWIMLANRYGDTSNDNYLYSRTKAFELAKRLESQPAAR